MTTLGRRFGGLVLMLVAVVLVFQGIYAGMLIYRSSILLEDQRWFCLLDDPMISMRYARNLADGLGLVWNEGERAEGITNPGWAFIMALVHLVEDNRGYTSLYMQVISALCIMATTGLTAWIAWRVSRGSVIVTLAAAVMAAFYFPLNYWAVFGMETGILGLFITAAVAVWLGRTAAGRFPWISYLVLGVATIIRVDAAVPLLVLGGYGTLTANSNRERMQHMGAAAATLAVFVGGQTLARLMYYGYPFPNTYYLKMTGFPAMDRVARGVFVTLGTLWTLFLPLILAGMLAGGVWAAKRGGRGSGMAWNPRYFQEMIRRPVMLVILVFFGQVAYSMYVGGDAWEDTVFCNRYVVVAFPMFAVFSSAGIVRLCRFAGEKLALKPGATAGIAALVLAAGFGYQNWNSVYLYYRDGMLLMRDNHLPTDSEHLIRIGRKITEDVPADWAVSVDWAGAVPYFIDHYVVDPLGKCDPHIAHMPMRRGQSPYWYKEFYPGHMKWDPDYTYETYEPDFMVFLWITGSGRDFAEILEAHYDQVELDDLRGVFYKHKKHVDVTF